MRGTDTSDSEGGQRLDSDINGGWGATSSRGTCPPFPRSFGSQVVKNEANTCPLREESVPLQSCCLRDDLLHTRNPPMAIRSPTTPPTIPPAITVPFGALRPDIVETGVSDAAGVTRHEVSVPLLITNSGDATSIPSPNASTTY